MAAARVQGSARTVAAGSGVSPAVATRPSAVRLGGMTAVLTVGGAGALAATGGGPAVPLGWGTGAWWAVLAVAAAPWVGLVVPRALAAGDGAGPALGGRTRAEVAARVAACTAVVLAAAVHVSAGPLGGVETGLGASLTATASAAATDALVALAAVLPLAWLAVGPRREGGSVPRAVPGPERARSRTVAGRRPLARTAVAVAGVLGLVAGLLAGIPPLDRAMPVAPAEAATCARTLTADVVALDQPIVYNRLGAVNPAGMIYALRRDVVPEPGTGPELAPGAVRLREGKRPRPLVLRLNVGDCLRIDFENLLDPVPLDDQPVTREAGVHVTGLQLVSSIADDGSFVGANPSLPGAEGSLVPPGGRTSYTYYGEREGAHVLSSTADQVSAESLTGTIAFGLFGAVNVEPRGSTWYRSQVTRAEMDLATTGTTSTGHPQIDYAARYPAGHPTAGLPVLGILDGTEIVHADLTAVVAGIPAGTYPPNPTYPGRGGAFRELTVMFHDEIKAIQAFPEFESPELSHTLHGVRDAFAINYGTAGIGAEILANRKGVGPSADCEECKYEEFFLSSWVVADPAMVVDVPANVAAPGAGATRALYPEDPSNVIHGYLGDNSKIRNLHVGKEHHVFHLHAHQWLEAPDDDKADYKDSQAIGPGSAHTYEIAFGGGGNRNVTVGDSIFHCHFYPHFSQGMWGLWRVHDVLERGTVLGPDGRPAPGSRALPDGEIVAGTPIPGVVPLPGRPMAPLPADGVTVGPEPGLPGSQVDLGAAPAEANPGYPFWVPGKAGHRPPTPPLDLVDDGGLPRHLVTGGTSTGVETPWDFSKHLDTAQAVFLPEAGTPAERAAMAFHAQPRHATTLPDGRPGQFVTNGRPAVRGAPFADPCRGDGGGGIPVNRRYQGANVEIDLLMNKARWHHPQSRIITLWQDVAPTLAGTRPPEPLVMRANSGDCVEYEHTNLVPHEYQQDAFQVRTPTDVIGQHIHLVKFDVTSADGSANGFNYEDGTFAPAEVRERIAAMQAAGGSCSGTVTDCGALAAQAHPFFGSGPGGAYLGARTTVQRWWVDPIRDRAGVDRGLGNVFTHDHFAPSTHQQTGLYAGLLVEPAGSTWRDPETGAQLGVRSDGGPTSWRADILPPDSSRAQREYFFAVQDFALAYEAGRGGTRGAVVPDPEGAINPPSKEEVDDRRLYRRLDAGDDCPDAPHRVGDRGCPEAVSAADPGTFVVNYRNEPLALRIRDPRTNAQAAGDAGDPSLAFSSRVRRADRDLDRAGPYPPLTGGVDPSDPFTPLARMYDGDRVNVRVLVGAHEEGHIGTISGVKWRQDAASPDSGWRNGQMYGLSEQFQFQAPIAPRLRGQTRGTTDYRYDLSAATDGVWNGTWGVARAYTGTQRDLLELPNNPVGRRGVTVRNQRDFAGVCPRSAPVVPMGVTAVLARDVLPGGTLVYNGRDPADPLHDPTAVLYVRDSDLDPATGRLRDGVPVEPLILRARAGDCLDVTVTNRLPAVLPHLDGRSGLPPIVEGFNANDVRASSQVGLRPQLVSYIAGADEGANVGLNDSDLTVRPGASRTYRWYLGDVAFSGRDAVATPVEFGATNLISSDPLEHASRGAVGALVVEPAGSTWTEDAGRRASATVRDASGITLFREHVVVLQDDVNLRRGPGEGQQLPFVAGAEDPEDTGGTAVNYRTEPLWLRAGLDPAVTPETLRTVQLADVLSNGRVGGDPQTPVFTSPAGAATRIRVLQPAGHARNHVIAVHGHSWQRRPYVTAGGLGSGALGSNPLSEHRGAQEGMGPSNHFDLLLQGGAGGAFGVRGDYLIRDMTPGRFYNGTWAVLRVE